MQKQKGSKKKLSYTDVVAENETFDIETFDADDFSKVLERLGFSCESARAASQVFAEMIRKYKLSQMH